MTSDFPISLLQRRVIELGICPACHEKALGEVFLVLPERVFYQCDHCLEIWDVPHRQKETPPHQ